MFYFYTFIYLIKSCFKSEFPSSGTVQYIDTAAQQLQLIECVLYFFKGRCRPNWGPKQDFIEKKVNVVTHTLQSCSAFNQSKVHTHTMNTHLEQSAAIYAAVSGEKLWVQCLAQGHLSRGIESGESAGHSLPPPSIPAGLRLELATFRFRVQLDKPIGHDFPLVVFFQQSCLIVFI